MNKHISNILFLIATLIWGFAFVAQKEASVIPAFTVGAVRSLLATVFLIIIIPLTDRLAKNGRSLLNEKRLPDFTKRELIGGCILGVILTVASAFQQIGIEGTDAGKAAFITALYVVIVPIFSTLLGKRPSLCSVASVPVAVIGFYFLCVKPGSALIPSDLLVLLCAVVFACHIITVDRASIGCNGFRMSCIQFLTAFILNSIVALILEGPVDLVAIGGQIVPLLYLGIMSSGIAYTLQILGQKGGDPTVSAIILSLESVFGVIGGALVLGETMSGREYLGCIIVFLAVILSQNPVEAVKQSIKKKKDKESPNI